MTDAGPFSTVTCKVAGVELILHPLKSIWYPDQHSLIISDAHLGKTNHFRKSGIAIPDSVEATNFERLEKLFNLFNPQRVIFLGDLFHSHLNSAWERFEQLLQSFNHIAFDLVVGNHDILLSLIHI